MPGMSLERVADREVHTSCDLVAPALLMAVELLRGQTDNAEHLSQQHQQQLLGELSQLMHWEEMMTAALDAAAAASVHAAPDLNLQPTTATCNPCNLCACRPI